MQINFLVNGGQIGLAIVIAVTIVGICAALYFLLAGHVHTKKIVNETKKKYDRIHDFLTIQLNQDLKRVGSIAEENVEYESIYNLNKNIYEEVYNNEDKAAANAVAGLLKLIADKKYKLIKDEIESVKEKISLLEEKVNQLKDSLGKIVSIDEENRQEILAYRRQLREIKENYESRKNELKFVEPSFTSVFNKIEEYFIETDRLLKGAHYTEAKEKFPEIEKVVYALDKAVNTLPKLVTLSYVVIPNSIQEMMNRYNELLSENYPLHHLKIQTIVDGFNIKIEEIHEKLTKFQSKNIEFELNQIRDEIIQINNDFDNEVKSKEYFNNNYESIYNGSYKLENRFIKLRRIIPDYKKAYVLEDTCLDKLQAISNEINELGTIKRTLDTYVHSSSQQPYSTLAGRLKDLDDAMNQIDDDINSIQLYLASLKKDSDEGYKFISEVYLELKHEEFVLRKINVPNYTLIIKPKLNQCFDYLNQAGVILQKLPIDVASLNRILIDAKNSIENVKKSTAHMEELAKQAEEAIVYANQYRVEFFDVKTVLAKADKSFAEGDFMRCSDETVNIIKKFSSK